MDNESPHTPQSENQPRPARKAFYRRPLGVALIVATVLVLFVATGFAVVAAGDYLREKEAISACHDAALKTAKHPGGAEFISTNTEGPDPKMPDQGPDVIHVSGYVDFPNGYGAPVRHTYLCTTNTPLFEEARLRQDIIVMEGTWLD